MDEKPSQNPPVLIMIFAAIGFIVVFVFLREKLGVVFDFILIGGFILFLAVGLMLRNLR